MLNAIIEIQFKRDLTLKETYAPLSRIIRLFIQKNNGKLYKDHYKKTFGNYSFGTPLPFNSNLTYRKDVTYHFELRSTTDEFLALREHVGLENEDVRIVGVNCGIDYYLPSGYLITETPAYMNSSRIETDEYENEIKEKVRENIVFRALKSEDISFAEFDDEAIVEELRYNVIKNIEIHRKPIGIPTDKVNSTGKFIVYYCIHLEIELFDTPLAKKVETLIFYAGVGKNTTNGYGFFRR